MIGISGIPRDEIGYKGRICLMDDLLKVLSEALSLGSSVVPRILVTSTVVD